MSLKQVELPEYAADLWKPFRHLAWHGGRGAAKSRSVATGLVIQATERHEREPVPVLWHQGQRQRDQVD
jgi:hypothetical protein